MIAPASPPPPSVVPRPELLACEECDALYQRTPLAPSQQARCARCGNLLGRGHRMSLQGMAALGVTTLVVFLIANLAPVVSLNLRGVPNSTTLPEALWATWNSGEHAIALIAAAVGFMFPLGVILLRLYVLWPVFGRGLPPGWLAAMRGLHFALRWSMVEVLLLAALVSIVRIAGMASVVPGAGLAAFGVLALLMAALQSAGEHRLWHLAPARHAAGGDGSSLAAGQP